VLFSSRVLVRISVRMRFSVWLVRCYAHVFVIVILTLHVGGDVRIPSKSVYFLALKPLISLQLSNFPSCFGTGVTNLNEHLSEFLLPPHYCWLGLAPSLFRAIANEITMRDKEVIYVTRLPSVFTFKVTFWMGQ